MPVATAVVEEYRVQNGALFQNRSYIGKFVQKTSKNIKGLFNLPPGFREMEGV